MLILEVGCNHKGDINIAKKFIKKIKQCGADSVKFQKRCNRELLNEKQYNSPHPNPENSYGATYGEHREFLEFTIEQHKELMNYCQQLDLIYSTSVWDVTSAKEIVQLNPKYIKIPSASNLNFDMLKILANDYTGEIHFSMGMTSHKEGEKIVSFFEKYNRAKDCVIYSCTSGYPVPPKDICLLEITHLKEKYEKRVKAIGFSGHHISIYPDIAAKALGAEYIERHFTLDRNWKGTDHQASLEPIQATELVTALKEIDLALKYKKTDFLDIELAQRKKLKNYL